MNVQTVKYIKWTFCNEIYNKFSQYRKGKLCSTLASMSVRKNKLRLRLSYQVQIEVKNILLILKPTVFYECLHFVFVNIATWNAHVNMPRNTVDLNIDGMLFLNLNPISQSELLRIQQCLCLHFLK